MKVALCFSGKLGKWKEAADSIVDNIIKPLQPDIFLFTWEDEKYRDFIHFYNPKRFSLLHFNDHKEKMKSNTIDYWAGLKPMTFGMKKVFKVFEDYCINSKNKYDLVIRIRPDIKVFDQIKTHEIKDCISRNLLKFPFYEGVKFYNHEEELKKPISFSFVYEKVILPRQINDQLCIGPVEIMKKYMNCFDSIETPIDYLWDNGYPDYMCKIPECILTTYLNLNNIKYSRLTGSSSFGDLDIKLIK